MFLFVCLYSILETVKERYGCEIMNTIALQIYGYVSERIQDDYCPTVREICHDLGIKSTSTVHKYLNLLVSQGMLEKADGLNRSLKLPGNGHSARIPVLGKVAAGLPITAVENIEGYIPFSGISGSAKEVFALRVQGESMINVGIFDGDYIIARQTAYAENGQMVVAMIDDSATVKTFYKEKGYYRLQPENDYMEPIIAADVLILGRVIGLVRNYE